MYWFIEAIRQTYFRIFQLGEYKELIEDEHSEYENEQVLENKYIEDEVERILENTKWKFSIAQSLRDGRWEYDIEKLFQDKRQYYGLARSLEPEEKMYKTDYEYIQAEELKLYDQDRKFVQNVKHFLSNPDCGILEVPKLIYVIANLDECVEKIKLYAPEVAEQYSDKTIGIIMELPSFQFDLEFEKKPEEEKNQVESYRYLIRLESVVENIFIKQKQLSKTREEYENAGTNIIKRACLDNEINQLESEIKKSKEIGYKYYFKGCFDGFISDLYLKEERLNRRYTLK